MQDNQAVTMLAALALDARLRVVALLSGAGAEGLAAGEIARRLQLQQNTLSNHLATLVRADILVSRRKGTSIIYRYRPGSLAGLTDLLSVFEQNVRVERAAIKSGSNAPNKR